MIILSKSNFQNKNCVCFTCVLFNARRVTVFLKAAQRTAKVAITVIIYIGVFGTKIPRPPSPAATFGAKCGVVSLSTWPPHLSDKKQLRFLRQLLRNRSADTTSGHCMRVECVCCGKRAENAKRGGVSTFKYNARVCFTCRHTQRYAIIMQSSRVHNVFGAKNADQKRRPPFSINV